jgi:hypothetical protein
MFVYAGIFALQIWIAERVLLMEDHRQQSECRSAAELLFICGCGQVGRTVVDQLQRLEFPFVLIETNEGSYRELLNNKNPVI